MVALVARGDVAKVAADEVRQRATSVVLTSCLATRRGLDDAGNRERNVCCSCGRGVKRIGAGIGRQSAAAVDGGRMLLKSICVVSTGPLGFDDDAARTGDVDVESQLAPCRVVRELAKK